MKTTDGIALIRKHKESILHEVGQKTKNKPTNNRSTYIEIRS